jgi:tripartite-type tricarboxylate transporter receptor subunit TctC
VIEKVLRETGAVQGVQFEHVPGAGGTVGLRASSAACADGATRSWSAA